MIRSSVPFVLYNFRTSAIWIGQIKRGRCGTVLTPQGQSWGQFSLEKFSSFSKKINTIRKLIKFCILHSSTFVQTPNVSWRDNWDNCPWGVKLIFPSALVQIQILGLSGHWDKILVNIFCWELLKNAENSRGLLFVKSLGLKFNWKVNLAPSRWS